MACHYCGSGAPHPMFLYFMSNRPSFITSIEDANNYLCYIGISHQPFARVHGHNRLPSYKVGAKITRQGAPHWQLEMVLGPIPGGQARTLKNLWRRSYRTITRRLLGGTLIAAEYDLPYYLRDTSTRELMTQLMNRIQTLGPDEEHTVQALDAEGDTDSEADDACSQEVELEATVVG